MNKSATYDDISEIIKERVDNFELKRQCIIDGHEALISKTESEIISFDQSINDYIIEQLDDDETNNWIKDLTEFGMSERYITTCTPRGIRIQSIMHTVMPFDCWKEQKEPKENHPYGWYRKFDKKRY